MDNTVRINLGKKLKSYRKDMKLSQEKFALLLDIDRTYYASVERGKRNISIDNLSKIAKGLNITLEKLFEGV